MTTKSLFYGTETSLVDVIAKWVRAAITADAQRRQYKQTVRELSALSQRELNDIGLSRWSIHDIASEMAYGARA